MTLEDIENSHASSLQSSILLFSVLGRCLGCNIFLLPPMFSMTGEAIKLHLVFSLPGKAQKKAPAIGDVNHEIEPAFVQTNPEDFTSHLVHRVPLSRGFWYKCSIGLVTGAL